MPNCGCTAANCGSPLSGLLTYIILVLLPVSRDHRLPLFFGVSPVFKYLCGSSSHHHNHNFWGSCEEWFLRTLCLLLLFSSAASMAVTTWHGTTVRGNTGKPRWVNPCELPGHVFDPSTDLENAPPIRLGELFNSVKERARVSMRHAANVKKQFLKLTFNDPDFDLGTTEHRQSWLPTVPPLEEQYFGSITKEEAFKMSFELLQFFAVGIEQVILDQVIHDGQFVSLFREVENHLTQVLCELQLGLFMLRIPTSPDVMRDVMSQEYRDIRYRSRRNIRDYLILRDYVKATQFVEELFAYLERTL